MPVSAERIAKLRKIEAYSEDSDLSMGAELSTFLSGDPTDRDMQFKKLADRMISSEIKRDFDLPIVKEEETAEGKRQVRRGIPIRFFAMHETLRWEWEENGKVQYADLIGGGKPNQ